MKSMGLCTNMRCTFPFGQRSWRGCDRALAHRATHSSYSKASILPRSFSQDVATICNYSNYMHYWCNYRISSSHKCHFLTGNCLQGQGSDAWREDQHRSTTGASRKRIGNAVCNILETVLRCRAVTHDTECHHKAWLAMTGHCVSRMFMTEYAAHFRQVVISLSVSDKLAILIEKGLRFAFSWKLWTQVYKLSLFSG